MRRLGNLGGLPLSSGHVASVTAQQHEAGTFAKYQVFTGGGPLLGLCRWRCETPNTQRTNMEDTAVIALFAVFFVLGVVLAVMFGSSPAPVPTRTPINRAVVLRSASGVGTGHA